MSISSLSFTFVSNLYQPAGAAPVAATDRRAAPAASPVGQGDEPRGRGPPNRLVQAIMTALREMGLGAAAPAPAAPAVPTAAGSTAATSTGATSPTTNTTTTTTAPTQATSSITAPVPVTGTATPAASAEAVASAVHQFAHELFVALRPAGAGHGSNDAPGRRDGEVGHKGHHGHHGWKASGYGDIAQRLDALAQSLAPATGTTPVGDRAALPASSVSITITLQEDASAAPAVDGALPTTASTTGAATAPVRNPLLDAFSTLFNAIKPPGTPATDVDMTASLRTFLEALATALRPESASSSPAPAVGSLLNLSA